MTLYKKQFRIIGVFYGGQGFQDEYRTLTDWYDEDDPEFERKQKTAQKEFDYFHNILKEHRYIKIES